MLEVDAGSVEEHRGTIEAVDADHAQRRSRRRRDWQPPPVISGEVWLKSTHSKGGGIADKIGSLSLR